MKLFKTAGDYDFESVTPEETENYLAVLDWAAHRGESEDLWPLRLALLDTSDDGRKLRESSIPRMGSNHLVIHKHFADSLGGELCKWGDFRPANSDKCEYLVMRANRILPRTMWMGQGVVPLTQGKILTLDSISFPKPELIPDEPFILESYENGEIWLPEPFVDLLLTAGAVGTKFIENPL